MPKKESVVNKYSVNEIMAGPDIASVILFDIMRDNAKLSEDKKKKMLNQVNAMGFVEAYPDLINVLYGKSFPKLAAEFKGINDVNEGIEKFIQYTKSTVPGTRNYYLREVNNYERYHEIFAEPVSAVVNGLKEVSKELGKYAKRNENALSEDEKAYISAMKYIIDDTAYGRDTGRKISRNPAYFATKKMLNANLRFQNRTVKINESENVNEKGQTEKSYNYEYDSADFKADWRNTITSISGTPIMETIKKGMDVQRKLDAFDRGDATREDMIAVYEDYARVSGKLFNMSREEFDEIYKRGNLQNKYEEFVNGGRSSTYAYHDAVAKAQLLKAGYPMDDVMELSQFYSYVQEVKRINDLKEESKRNPEVDARYDKMMEVWNKVVAGRKLTEEKRLENIRAVKEALKELSDMVPAQTYKESAFANVEMLNNLTGVLTERENAPLTLNQKIVMGGSAASMFKALDDADPGWMISSTEFKNMKEAVERLSKINRKADPGMYEIYRDKVIDTTKKYIDYKNKELNNPRKNHKRSERELRRVAAANAIYNRMLTIAREDTLADNMKNKPVVVDDNIEFKNARAFIRVQRLIDVGLEDISRELTDYAAVLMSTQKNANHNPNEYADGHFVDPDNPEGSHEYQRMANSLQDAISAVKNRDTRPSEIEAKLKTFIKHAGRYEDTHNNMYGIGIGPVTSKGDTRLDISRRAMEEVPNMIARIVNMRAGLRLVRDPEGNGYSDRSYNEINDKAMELQERFKDDILRSPRIQTEANYSNLKEATAMQMEILKEVRKFDPFMADNYKIGEKADVYGAMLREGKMEYSRASVAKHYVAKQFLDNMYKPGIKPDELDKMSVDIKNKLEKEAASLKGDMLFKTVAYTYPTKLMGKWDEIINGGTIIQKTATKKLANLTNDGKSLTDYVLNGDQETMYERLAEVKVYQEISRVTEKSPNLISRCLAADSNPNKQQVVNNLIKEQTGLMKKMCPDPVSRRADFEQFVNKPGDHMLGRAVKDADKKLRDVRQQSRMSARNKNVNKQNAKAKAVGPK